MNTGETYTLDTIVDLYLAQRQIDRKKYYPSYLINANLAWKKLFRNTIYSTQSEWMTLKKGEPYNYIEVPRGTVRLFSVCEVDHCGRIVPLFYDSLLNVIPKPTKRDCGIKKCDCSGLCDDLNSVTYNTKLLFTISGVDYYEKIWIKLCGNGDIIEYREVPTKKYNTFTGDGGDYNTDYNNDYNIIPPPFSDYTIVTETFQKVICSLTVRPCGCPDNTPENEEKVMNNCSQFFTCFGEKHRKHCEQYLVDINDNHRGSVKLSDCGNKIFYKPSPRHHHHHNLNNGIPHNRLPEFLLVNYQLSGESCHTAAEVPELAQDAMFFGIDYFSKRFNLSFSMGERKESEYAWINAQNELIKDLNPISLEYVSQIQDAKILW